ncbi:hypothetical protein GXY_08095 [Novacetimonas hansenii ATCC 23769]|uniref:Uncharacterized protein n=1 Tax=Novacetimonas hansenii ATCC 23769 TaxID=714995 RepID=D5QEQ4_NOVHA|nr:hypothetical protein GXY_08095 [Novacetimonas hansenii ATCC 23769]
MSSVPQAMVGKGRTQPEDMGTGRSHIGPHMHLGLQASSGMLQRLMPFSFAAC